MGERGPEQSPEAVIERTLEAVIGQYFGEEYRGFFAGHDLEDRIGAVYGMLLENGHDPLNVLIEAGILRGGDDEV